MNNPAEMPGPDDPGFGSAGRIPFPKEVPQEITPFVARSLLAELISVRNRVHAIENAAIIARFRGIRGMLGEIQELEMETGEGGGGGGGWPPGEIHEINEIAELRPFTAIEALVNARIESLRAEFTAQIAELTRKIDAKGG